MTDLTNKYAEAWKASFLAANPFHTVVMRDEDVVHMEAGVAAATAPLLERIAALEAERDEADRRAGNAERTKQGAIDDMCKRASWLDKAKSQWGVDNNVSFDVVWAECLALKPKVAELEAALSKSHQINFRRFTSADAACAALEAKLAQLEAALRDARSTMQWHTDMTRPIGRTADAIAAIDKLLKD